MTRVKKQEPAGLSLSTAVRNAWASFEDPDSQERRLELSAEEHTKASEREIEKRIKKLRRWGAPKIAATLVANESYSANSSLEALMPDRLLQVLAGNPGCGKTTAAVSVFESRNTGIFVRAAEIVELGNHFSDRNMLRSYRRCGVLIIDDLGVEHRDEKMICRLDELLDSRTASGLSTLITTNMPADEFRGRYEERIWSRINQFGDYHESADPDFRVTPIATWKRH